MLLRCPKNKEKTVKLRDNTRKSARKKPPKVQCTAQQMALKFGIFFARPPLPHSGSSQRTKRKNGISIVLGLQRDTYQFVGYQRCELCVNDAPQGEDDAFAGDGIRHCFQRHLHTNRRIAQIFLKRIAHRTVAAHGIRDACTTATFFCVFA